MEKELKPKDLRELFEKESKTEIVEVVQNGICTNFIGYSMWLEDKLLAHLSLSDSDVKTTIEYWAGRLIDLPKEEAWQIAGEIYRTINWYIDTNDNREKE